MRYSFADLHFRLKVSVISLNASDMVDQYRGPEANAPAEDDFGLCW
ncbi:hypothetical protein [Rosistilla oblonga]